ncbi:phenylalanine ammonia-lyase [Aureococcus anophagefferens]|nr:phenylalanine ammonia-lyase [Aureococcus anophagefferens]
MLLALRINVLAKGRSGVSIGVLEAYVEAYNADAISVVPSQGTVDAPSCWRREISSLALGPKDGLALINGTQMMTALGAEAVCRAKRAALAADVACALTVEALRARTAPTRIHAARPRGPVGGRGAAAEAAAAAVGAVDVPRLRGPRPGPLRCAARPRRVPAKACDYLAIGVAELANISERRTERLMNGPVGAAAFLTADGGFNSGFMIAHCTAAALASENKLSRVAGEDRDRAMAPGIAAVGLIRDGALDAVAADLA